MNELLDIVCDTCDDTGIYGWCEFIPIPCRRCKMGLTMAKELSEGRKKVDQEWEDTSLLRKLFPFL